MSEVHSLETSNAQLRQLLAQYMTDPANSELHIPPSATILIDPSSLAMLSAAATAARRPPVAPGTSGLTSTRSPLISSVQLRRAGQAPMVSQALSEVGGATMSSTQAFGPHQSSGMLSVTSSPAPVQRSRHQQR